MLCRAGAQQYSSPCLALSNAHLVHFLIWYSIFFRTTVGTILLVASPVPLKRASCIVFGCSNHQFRGIYSRWLAKVVYLAPKFSMTSTPTLPWGLPPILLHYSLGTCIRALTWTLDGVVYNQRLIREAIYFDLDVYGHSQPSMSSLNWLMGSYSGNLG